MRLRINALLVAALGLSALAGCQEPKEIVPVAPPGFERVRTPSTPQGEGAQAIGEQGAMATSTKQNTVPSGSAGSPPTPIGQPAKSASGLVYETLKEGTGETAKSGQMVTMHYTGTLADGKVFDSSRAKDKPGKPDTPFETTIGVGQVIRGWDEGVPGMKVGEVRKLSIPAELGYGSRGAPPDIPPDAPLIFEVELLGVK